MYIGIIAPNLERKHSPTKQRFKLYHHVNTLSVLHSGEIEADRERARERERERDRGRQRERESERERERERGDGYRRERERERERENWETIEMICLRNHNNKPK